MERVSGSKVNKRQWGKFKKSEPMIFKVPFFILLSEILTNHNCNKLSTNNH